MIGYGLSWGIAYAAPVGQPAGGFSVRQYRDFITGIAPARLQSPPARALLEAIGQELDATLELLTRGVAARWPQFAPADALAFLGQARLIERFPGEGLEDYRARVIGARDFWELAGTDLGMLTALEQLGYIGRVHPWAAPRQSEFDITLSPGRRTFNGSQAEVDRIVRVIRRVKKADSELFRVFYCPQLPANSWGQSGLTWGQSGLTWGAGRTEIYRRP